MSLGVIVGKFLPLHTGHINFINKCSTKVDKLIVVLCYSDKNSEICKDNGIPEIKKTDQLRWLHTIYQDIEHIEIRSIDESNIPVYPDGWKEYIKLVKEVVPEKIDYMFSSEPAYDEHYKKLLPEAEHIIVDPDRKDMGISATMVRSDPFKYWEFIPSVVRPFFVKKIVIVGTESCGKTTLTKFLAKAFNTSWVEEYGRNYIFEECGGSEDNLVYEDYIKIAMHHKKLEEEAIRSSNKVVFIDTEAIVTQFYCKLYEGKEDPAISEIIQRQEYDLWIYLHNDVKWVDDGLRKNGSQEDREKGKKILFELLERYSIFKNMVTVRGNYEERLEKVIKLVREKFFNN